VACSVGQSENSAECFELKDMVQLNRQYDRDEEPASPISIKVVGIGGAGSNILDRMVLDGPEEIQLIAINTDVQSLAGSVATHKVQLGRTVTRGLGSGGDPELGLAAAEEATEEIRKALKGGDVIIVCAGLGGGTGSGATPWVVQLAKEEKALVLVIAALPFTFEGRRRCGQAAASLEQLGASADAVICFENDRMAEIALPRMGIHEAFAAADLTISRCIRAIVAILRRPGLLKVGFDDVRAVLRGRDSRGLFGFGEAVGENRAHEALALALKNPLMNRGEMLHDSYHAIIYIRGGSNVTLGEVQIIMEELNRHINDRTKLFMGISVDPEMGQRLSVSIISSLGSPLEQEASLLPSATRDEPVLPAQPERVVDAGQFVPNTRPTEFPEADPGHSEALLPEMDLERFSLSEPEPIPEKESTPPLPREPGLKPASRAPAVKKVEAKQEVLPFEPVSRGRFEKSEPTIVDGQDLDVPTFLRKQVKFR
jgi:cell division protein FtsZ